MAFGGGIVPALGGPQCWDYTFTGAEGVHFAIALPIARQDSRYGITVTAQTDPDTYAFSYDTKTNANFMLRTSAQVPAGKKITLNLEVLTA